jgi:hypothetical protein
MAIVDFRGRSELRRFAISAAVRRSVSVPMTIWFSRPSSSYFPLDHIFVISQLRKHERVLAEVRLLRLHFFGRGYFPRV